MDFNFIRYIIELRVRMRNIVRLSNFANVVNYFVSFLYGQVCKYNNMLKLLKQNLYTNKEQ